LRKLSVADVRSALAVLSGQLSTRSLQIAHNCLVRAIRHAESNDLVGRNVAALIRPPAGHEGRPSKALSVELARALLRAAAAERPGGAPHRLHAYVVLLLTTGLRPEEARSLRWDHVDLDAGTVAVWRSDRAGGDTKTPKSRRTLRLAQVAVDALRQRKAAQAADRLKAGEAWQDTGLVFTTTIGTMFDQHNIRRGFRQITRAAGLGDEWVPRELRHAHLRCRIQPHKESKRGACGAAGAASAAGSALTARQPHAGPRWTRNQDSQPVTFPGLRTALSSAPSFSTPIP
jgi:integrase